MDVKVETVGDECYMYSYNLFYTLFSGTLTLEKWLVLSSDHAGQSPEYLYTQSL